MKFEKATQQNQYTSLAVYGPAGSGKTILGLSAPGKKQVIDTEGGSLPYASLTEFDVMHTQSFGDIKNAIDDMIAEPPAEETTLIIDSASLIWQGLQQSMLEKKLKEKGLTAESGTEKVQFALADWGILKRWNSDIFNGLMAIKAHKVCTFRENEVMDEVTFKKTGVFAPQWEKNTPYIFDFVGRLADRTFTFTKGRLARNGKVIDLVGKKVSLPTISEGKDLPAIWKALFGDATEKPEAAKPISREAAPETLDKHPESITIAKQIRSKLLPKYGISNDDFDTYCVNKILKDGRTPLAVAGDDGKVHLSTIQPDLLRWLVQVLESDGSRMALLKRIAELKKAAK